MDKLNYNTLAKVFKLNIVIGVSATIFASLIMNKYTNIIFVGLILAFVNFTLNSMITHWLLKDGGSGLVLLYIISFIVRVLLPGVIAFILFTNNMYDAFLFLGGFCLHFVSLIIISAKILFDKEGK